MLRYSLLLLFLAHCAVNGLVNDGDAAKSAGLATVVAIDPLPKPVVGLPSNETAVANATQSSDATQSSNSTQLAGNSAAGNANSTKSDGVVQKANITEMGGAKIKSDADSKSTNGTSALPADHQESEATKSTIDVEPSEKLQTDIKEPDSSPRLDSEAPPVPNSDGEQLPESSKKNDTEVSSENEEGDKTTTLEESSTETSTVSTTGESEVTTSSSSSSSSSSSTTEVSSTTDESVSTVSTNSNATEPASTEAIASTVEASASTVEASTSTVESTPEDEGMSSGIVALTMAIVFAIAVVIVYVGLLLWRRYLEYRYGTRELLVNDLEFDTNDLHHFEL